jgi:hypothetical protein
MGLIAFALLLCTAKTVLSAVIFANQSQFDHSCKNDQIKTGRDHIDPAGRKKYEGFSLPKTPRFCFCAARAASF